jgi:mRNA interferase RelE/StbE
VNYALLILPRAEKELSALDSRQYELVKKKIYELRGNPRPPGCRKLTGEDGWRVRVSDYRVIYEIDDRDHVVTILRVAIAKKSIDSFPLFPRFYLSRQSSPMEL